MKKTTKVLALLATALMAFAVVGCKNPGSDPKPQPENTEIELVKDLQLGWSGTDTITEGKDIAVGGTIYFTITATGAQELQFIKKSWAGGLGTDVIAILNADNVDVTYYAKGEGANDPKDRPAVGLEDDTATFHFVVTEKFVALKDVATVVGSAKLDKMWYVAE